MQAASSQAEAMLGSHQRAHVMAGEHRPMIDVLLMAKRYDLAKVALVTLYSERRETPLIAQVREEFVEPLGFSVGHVRRLFKPRSYDK